MEKKIYNDDVERIVNENAIKRGQRHRIFTTKKIAGRQKKIANKAVAFSLMVIAAVLFDFLGFIPYWICDFFVIVFIAAAGYNTGKLTENVRLYGDKT